MSVDDNWGECIRKSADQVVDGDKTEYHIKTRPSLAPGNRSALGDNLSESMEPVVQVSGVYGLTAEVESFTSGGGTATTTDGMYICSTSTGVGDYGVIRTVRNIIYREGQGLAARFTAIFDGNAVANSLQFGGLFNLTDTIAFGYRGADFGIIHDSYGNPEIRTLTVTTPGNGTLVLTLDDTAYNIPITTGTAAHNAYEIAEWLNANQSVWTAQQIDGTVVLQARDTSLRDGTYSVSGAGFAGSFSTNQTGSPKSESTILRAAWDDNPSWFDPTVSNVYMIKMTLGFGPISFFVMNTSTGEWERVHRIFPLGTAVKPSISKRALKVGWACASLGSTTALTVKGPYCAGFIEGESKVFGETHSVSATNTSVDATFEAVVSIQARVVYNNTVMLGRIVPIRVRVANDSTKPVEYVIVKNASYGETNYTAVDSTSIALVDISNGVITGSYAEIDGGVMAAGASQTADFDDLDIDFQLGDTITVFARKVAGTNPSVTARITWKEDF